VSHFDFPDLLVGFWLELRFFSPLDLCGLGGVLSIRFKTASRRRAVSSSVYSPILLGVLLMPEYPVRYRLPISYSTEIGRIITRWAFLEYRLKETAYMLLDIDPKIGRIAVREPRTYEYVDMIQDLMSLRSLTTTVDLKKLRKTIEDIQSFRDKLAHGIWAKHDATNLPVLQITKGSYTLTPGEQKTKARIDPFALVVQFKDLRAARRNIERTTITINQWKRDLSAQL
jgi:hypothetical protein